MDVSSLSVYTSPLKGVRGGTPGGVDPILEEGAEEDNTEGNSLLNSVNDIVETIVESVKPPTLAPTTPAPTLKPTRQPLQLLENESRLDIKHVNENTTVNYFCGDCLLCDLFPPWRPKLFTEERIDGAGSTMVSFMLAQSYAYRRGWNTGGLWTSQDFRYGIPLSGHSCKWGIG